MKYFYVDFSDDDSVGPFVSYAAALQWALRAGLKFFTIEG